MVQRLSFDLCHPLPFIYKTTADLTTVPSNWFLAVSLMVLLVVPTVRVVQPSFRYSFLVEGAFIFDHLNFDFNT